MTFFKSRQLIKGTPRVQKRNSYYFIDLKFYHKVEEGERITFYLQDYF